MNPDIILALDGICRLCLTLTEKSELVDIFDSNVALRIMGCVAVEVNPKDPLPHQICTYCRYHLEKTQWFRVTCQKSAAKLKRFVKRFKRGKASKISDISDDEEDQDDDVDLTFIQEYEERLFGGGGSIVSNDFALQEDQHIDLVQEEDEVKETEEANTEIMKVDNIEVYYEETIDVEENKEVVTIQSPTKRKQKKGQKRKRGNFAVKGEDAVNVKILDSPLRITYSVVDVEVVETEQDAASNQEAETNVTFLRRRSNPKYTKEFKCGECDSAFSSNQNLAKHMQMHNLSSGMLSCDFCSKWFQTKSSKHRHELIHTGQRPYECVECNKSFSQKAILDRHMYTHATEKPFRCQSCGMTFMQKGFLASHIKREHSGNMVLEEYECNQCPKTFKHRSGLSRHMMQHSEKVFACQNCHKSFKDCSSFKRHKRNVHHIT